MVSVKEPALPVPGKETLDAADQRPPTGPLRTTWTVLAAGLTAAGTAGTLATDDKKGWVLLGLVGLAGLVAFGRQVRRARALRVAARTALEARLAEATAALAEHDSIVAALRAETAAQEQENDLLRAELAAREEQNAALRSEIAGQRDRILALHTEIAALETRETGNELALRQARTAIERIVDRQFPLYEEEVEITVMIGEHGDDMVIERHRTTPEPYVVYRVIRPITATTGRTRPAFAELELTCEMAGDDAGASVQLISETAEGPLVLVLFQPGLRETEEWTLRYRAPRLWEPLRADGMDRLGWAPSTRDGREPTIPVTALTVHFVFPPGTRSFAVRECHDLGHSIREHDERRVTWRDPAPAVRWYEWELWWSRAD